MLHKKFIGPPGQIVGVKLFHCMSNFGSIFVFVWVVGYKSRVTSTRKGDFVCNQHSVNADDGNPTGAEEECVGRRNGTLGVCVSLGSPFLKAKRMGKKAKKQSERLKK